MTDDLVAFLRARLAEDEAVARAATDGPWVPWEGRELNGLGDLIHPVRTPGQMAGSRATVVTASWLDAEHIARHDPARVMREVEAKRQILTAHGGDLDEQSMFCGHCEHDTPCPTLRAVAAVYADHPDYRQEWTP